MKNGFLDGLGGAGEPSGRVGSSRATAYEGSESRRGQGCGVRWGRPTGEFGDQRAEPPNDREDA